jgi:hypothetical protein
MRFYREDWRRRKNGTTDKDDEKQMKKILL